MRVARELPDGSYVNLGIGIPTLVSQFIPEGRTVIYHSENGILNYGPMAPEGEEDIDLINAGGQFLQPVPGMAFFHSAEAFGMIRGGHIDVSVLGALQVSQRGGPGELDGPCPRRRQHRRGHGPGGGRAGGSSWPWSTPPPRAITRSCRSARSR